MGKVLLAVWPSDAFSTSHRQWHLLLVLPASIAKVALESLSSAI